MSEQSRFVFRAGDELQIAFAPFSVRVAFHAGQRLTVDVVEGENAGFSDTVDYEAVVVRKGIILLSWQEHIGSTIVHVLDFTHARSHTCVTPANGGFLRLYGTLDTALLQRHNMG